ncbi:MAG: alpha/beta fold hydrolase [Rhizobacter sp.]|nr:alpha/beta fold hydrolase [Rhizobacter sp.]
MKGAPAAYAPALGAGIQATTTRVQEMHTAIADKSFRHLLAVPGLSGPAALVKAAHDAIAGGVYAAVRHGTGAAAAVVGVAERRLRDPHRPPAARERTVLGAMSGVAGDALARAGDPLAVPMTLERDGQALDAQSQAWAALGPRVCVFIHGLACDEQSWQLFSDAWQGTPWQGESVHYGCLLEQEFGLSAVYLRYNTGLAIRDNAQGLASQLEQLISQAPQVRDIVLVAHSMGGLVARLATEQAGDSAGWADLVRCVVCLGTPHRGAPLERIGHVAAAALSVSDVTRPLAVIANSRSQGIKDLRHGLPARPSGPCTPPLRLVAGSLSGTSAGARAGLRSLLGDGLVTTASACDERLQGDVERVELAGLGHMALLNHPRVYELLRRWLGVPRG